ncbi:MAG: ABC transporter permease subunit [Acidimicrobiales bacterium]
MIGHVVVLAGGRSDPPSNLVEWFTDLENRASSAPIPEQVWLTVWHSAVAVLVVVLLAVPLAVVLAHHRKGELAASWIINIGRAVPTITIVGLLVIISLRNGFGLAPWPIIIALVLLGLPPAFTNTYAAIRAVEPSAVSAAQAMGFGHAQVMARVELPLALPVIFAGVRTAAVQIVATEPLAAFFGSEGLGAYLRSGLSTRDFAEVQAGAVLVAGVAIAVELGLILVGRVVLPEGVRLNATTARSARRLRRSAAPATT